ncbi:MAG: IS6 family transposase [Proteobacteria bacterium]|nr:IS6 family transposase [Pseudomonadota bacterium]
MEAPFKWRHYQQDIILLSVRWYLSYALSYRDLVEILQERGLNLAHTTIMRWVHHYAPQIEKKVKRHLKKTNDSWKVDETYIKVHGTWMYLYRAIDSEGNTLEFMLSAKRNSKAAKRFFKKVIKAKHTSDPRVINVDKNAAYPVAIKAIKKEKRIKQETQLRQVKYLNNLIEQDHRFIKRITKHTLGFKDFHCASKTLRGIEAMHMLRKRQVHGSSSPEFSRANFVNELFKRTA